MNKEPFSLDIARRIDKKNKQIYASAELASLMAMTGALDITKVGQLGYSDAPSFVGVFNGYDVFVDTNLEEDICKEPEDTFITIWYNDIVASIKQVLDNE